MSKLAKAAVFVALAFAFVVLILLNAFAHVRGTLADRLYSGAPALQDIVIVRIDDASIARLGRWPWSRDIEARLLQKLAGARAIGVDISFLDPSEDDALLEEALASTPHVVLAAEMQYERLRAPIFPSAYGVVNLVADTDGTTRRFDPALAPAPFAFAIAKELGISPPPLAGPTLINFIGPPGAFMSVSAKDVLATDRSYAGKIVLIGATAPDLHDTYFVPTSDGTAMPGVEIHATILQNVILRTFLSSLTPLVISAIVIGVGLFGMFVLPRVRILYSIPIVVALLVAYEFSAVVLFEHHQVVADVFFTPLALLVFTGAGIGIRFVEEKRKAMYLRQAFSKYVSRELLSELLANKQSLTLGGEKRTVTVLFSDIRDFTAISETLAPEVLVPLLNEYLTAMTGVVLRHHGTVDKFIGDAIMALWNAPMTDEDHAFRACAAALEQASTIQGLQARWAERGVPILQVGIGINTGPAVVGNMGSEDRFDYTAIGDTINLASRIERLTKLYGVSVIVSEQTHALLKGRLLCCRLDLVRVKGKREPIAIYRLCDESERAYVAAFETALERYFAGEFSAALDAFRAAASIQADTPSALFIERCKQYMEHPPEVWDGAVLVVAPS